MYKIGDTIIYGVDGICEITDISTLDLSGVPSDKEYYTLRVIGNNMTIFAPVGSAKSKMRKIITYDDAENLISRIPEIEPLKNTSERVIEQTYKEYLLSYDYEKWISLIKFIYERKQKRLNAGKKVTVIDEKNMKRMEEMLYQELSIALNISSDEVLNYITEKIKDKK
ncbi:MAG: CarD family transcriptional regulator [Eubacteriales bacterium]|nr:CarD family transcriptional regulator [Eubacteriales bacterium]